MTTRRGFLGVLAGAAAALGLGVKAKAELAEPSRRLHSETYYNSPNDCCRGGRTLVTEYRSIDGKSFTRKARCYRCRTLVAEFCGWLQ